MSSVPAESNSNSTSSHSIPVWLEQTLTSKDHFRQVLGLLSRREVERRTYMVQSTNQQQLPSSTLSQDRLSRFSARLATHRHNAPKNRYIDVIPYDYNIASAREGSYLNASWVQEVYGGRWWCAAQAPPPHCFHDFYSLCITPTTPPGNSHDTILRRIPVIIQLTRDVEGRVRKAHPYLPPPGGTEHIASPDPSIAPISARFLSRRALEEARTVHTQVLLNNEYVVDHYLYEGWPDHGVPESSVPLITLATLVDESVPYNTPVLIHCSAGIGRTGSFIALCSLLRWHGFLAGPQVAAPMELALGDIPPALSDDEVVREIDGLRDQRSGMVQKDEQVAWIYKTLFEAVYERKS